MPRFTMLLRAPLLPLTLALASACGGTAAPATSEPAPTPSEPVADAPAPPMYKPSSNSKAPMSIADPAYGAYGDAAGAPGMGAKLPDFEIALADGGTFELSQARQAGPVLVMFYRGFW